MNQLLYKKYFSRIRTIAFIGQRGIPPDFPGTSGVEYYTYQQMKTLIAKNKTVLSYIRRWAIIPQQRVSNRIVTFHTPSINTKHLDTITYALLASIHVCFTDAHIVWYQGIGPALFAFLPRLCGKQVITTIHSADWQRKKWDIVSQIILRLSASLAIKTSHAITCVSNTLTDQLSRQYHMTIYLDRIHTRKYQNVVPEIIKQKYHLHPNRYVLFLGRFVPEKRIDWLIQASSEIPGIPFVLSGGSSHSDAYVRDLKTMATNKNIIFTGYVFGKEKAELLSNCMLFVLPSSTEGYPISVAEAIGFNKLCLVGDFLKNEYNRNNKRMYYFETKNYSSFIKELKQLISSVHAS